MKKLFFIVTLALLMILPLAFASAQGPQDDASFFGGTITVSDTVDGDVFALCGTITLNAPIDGDVIIAGGRVTINDYVEGKVIVFGGDVEINGSIGELITAAGKVTLSPSSLVRSDAKIVAGDVVAQGTVVGTLNVRSDSLDSSGTYGQLEYSEDFSDLEDAFDTDFSHIEMILKIVGWILLLGYFLVGITLVKVFPSACDSVYFRLRTRPIVAPVVGFVTLFLSIVLALFLLITIIGIPYAILLGILLTLSYFLATIVVAYSLGMFIFDRMEYHKGQVIPFTVGFIILEALYRIPYAGWVVHLVVLCAGIGAMAYAVKESAR